MVDATRNPKSFVERGDVAMTERSGWFGLGVGLSKQTAHLTAEIVMGVIKLAGAADHPMQTYFVRPQRKKFLISLQRTCMFHSSRHPEVRWAQRIDKVYITVQLPDAKDAKVNLEPDGVFSFSATAGTDGNSYESKLDLNDKVNVEASKISVGVRSIFCIVEKAEAKWWNKLVRDDQKAPHFVKVDWDKWVDEDDDGADINVDGMDFANMGGMGGLGGMGGMGDLASMMGGMGGMGGMGMPQGMGGMGMDEFDDESDEEGEVSKPQDEGKADAAEKPEEVEARVDTAQVN
ncbi:hypothetical protein ACQ4PT_028679 [Festuca glaucescens]